jgi:hypothetical protein
LFDSHHSNGLSSSNVAIGVTLNTEGDSNCNDTILVVIRISVLSGNSQLFTIKCFNLLLLGRASAIIAPPIEPKGLEDKFNFSIGHRDVPKLSLLIQLPVISFPSKSKVLNIGTSNEYIYEQIHMKPASLI